MNNSGSLTLSLGLQGVGLAYNPTGVRVVGKIIEAASQTLGFGTGSGQMNLTCDFDLVIAATSSTTIDLYDGSVLDIFGQPAPFRTLRLFAAWVYSGGDSSGVTISPGASNGHSLWWGGTNPTKTIYPTGAPESGGSPAGVAVTSSANTVKFTNNGAAGVTVTVVLGGGNA